MTPRPDAATAPRRIVVGVSGATGIVYAARLLEVLRQAGTETHLVVTPAAGMTRACETDMSAEDLRALAGVSYPIGDLTAPISSGSFQTMGMIVAPCSMRSLAEIAYGMTSNLLTRAADVTLKERRRLVLMARETPLSMTHLRAMIAVTESGGAEQEECIRDPASGQPQSRRNVGAPTSYGSRAARILRQEGFRAASSSLRGWEESASD